MIPIEEIKGNVLDFPNNINVVLQGCNICNTMGAGLAAQIKNRYPEAFRVDTICHENGTNKLGEISVADVGKNKKIVNLYQQTLTNDKSGKNLNFDALYLALHSTKTWLDSIKSEGDVTIGVPLGLASGLAVGHFPGYCPFTWDIVKGMLKMNFSRYDYPVIVVEYDPNN